MIVSNCDGKQLRKVCTCVCTRISDAVTARKMLSVVIQSSACMHVVYTNTGCEEPNPAEETFYQPLCCQELCNTSHTIQAVCVCVCCPFQSRRTKQNIHAHGLVGALIFCSEGRMIHPGTFHAVPPVFQFGTESASSSTNGF